MMTFINDAQEDVTALSGPSVLFFFTIFGHIYVTRYLNMMCIPITVLNDYIFHYSAYCDDSVELWENCRNTIVKFFVTEIGVI